MIESHQKLVLKDESLIEKIVIKAPFRFTANFQDQACFIYFIEGKTIINSVYGQSKVSHHDSVLLKCGSYFADLLKYIDADRFEVLVFHLYPDVLRRIYKDDIPTFLKPAKKKTFSAGIAKDDLIKKFIESLCFYLENPSVVSDELLELKIKELILLLIQTRNSESVMNLFSELFSPRKLSLKELVHNNLFSQLSIEDLATLSNLSLSTFNRSFKNIFGSTPAHYIKTKRLEKAKELLAISSLTISEIAFQTCFNDIGHFSRSFKSTYGCSPTEYRSSLKK